MKIQKKQNNKKPLIITLSILVILITSITIFVIINPMHNSSLEQNGINSESSNGAPTYPTNNPEDPQITGDSDSKPGLSNPSAPSNETLSIVIPYKNVEGSNLKITAEIDGVLSTGTCTLTLKNNSVTIEKTASVTTYASSSTCQGFSVPVSELPSGTWSISLQVISGDKSGTVTAEVSI